MEFCEVGAWFPEGLMNRRDPEVLQVTKIFNLTFDFPRAIGKFETKNEKLEDEC